MTAPAVLAQASMGSPATAPTSSVRRRVRAPRGLLLQRAYDLRDELPSGRRRADPANLRPTVQVIAGIAATGAGLAVLQAADASWKWLGALAVVLGPGVFMLGLLDLVNQGERAGRRVARLFRVIRVAGVVFTTVAVAVGLTIGLTALALLGASVWQQEWTPTTEMLLVNAILIAFMGAALSLLVSVTDLPAVPLGKGVWRRELWIIKQTGNVTTAVAIVGAAVALSLHDARAVVVAMIGFTMVLVSWARAESAATDDGVRRLAAAADALATAVRPLVESPARESAVPRRRHHHVIEALAALDLACYRSMRRGMFPAGPTYLVDLELLAVIRACKSVLASGSLESVRSPLAATVARDLLAMGTSDLEREILVLASDVRSLATRAPDREASG